MNMLTNNTDWVETNGLKWRKMPIYYTKRSNLEEERMSLSKRYSHAKLTADDRLARKVGAIDENGELTEEGKGLLLKILLQDEEISRKFKAAVRCIDEAEDNDAD